MPIFKRKYEITIRNRTCHYLEGKIFYCDAKTKEEIKNYLKQIQQEINSYGSTPEDSCINRLDISFIETQSAKILLGDTVLPIPKNISQECAGHLCINIDLRTCSKCQQQDCLQNITKGKCQDTLARKLIGEKLFKDAYTNKK